MKGHPLPAGKNCQQKSAKQTEEVGAKSEMETNSSLPTEAGNNPLLLTRFEQIFLNISSAKCQYYSFTTSHAGPITYIHIR